MRRNNKLIYLMLIIAFIGAILISCSKKEKDLKKILYYTCGMHPSVKVSPEDYEKGNTKCPICHMDLVPVYKKDAKDKNKHREESKHEMEMSTIKITKRQEILADVRTAKVTVKPVKKVIRTAGTIEYDETKIAYVTSYINGRIEKLFVNFTGDYVKKNQPLALVYSPELVSTQEEYLKTLSDAKTFTNNEFYQTLLQSARERLKLWGITDKEIDEIEKTGKPKLTMTIVSPINGIVVHKKVIEQQYVKEGTPLYHIVDLSKVWIKADIYEFEFPFIKLGQSVKIESVAYPGESFYGKITFIDPVLNLNTRTVKVRVEIPNPGLKLKPGMFVTAKIKANLGKRLVVPRTAILDTGIRKVVYVKLRTEEDGSVFAPRIVKTGVMDEENIEIIKGLKYGEEVVVSAAYLIDSQAELTGVGAEYGGALKVKKHQH